MTNSSKPRNSVRFYLNGQFHEVVPSSPTQTVLQYLRDDKGMTGTKEGCNEGDCGACTVTKADLNSNGEVELRSVNACIRYLPTLDGKVVWTIEALAANGTLHPAQQAMVDYHGSQCGFCTPGFLMSMYTMYHKGLVQPNREQVLEHLSGNLCRCTGYRPIIDAARNMHQYPAPPFDLNQVAQQLHELSKQCAQELVIDSPAGQYWAPRTPESLAALFEQHPDAVLLAGGTDVGLWTTKLLQSLNKIIYIGDVAAYDKIETNDDGIIIYAMASLNDGYEAMVAEYPEALEMWKRFASMPIRNSGTFVGNLANGSPIGDSAPFLIAVQAQVVLRKGSKRRELPLEDLYVDYRKQAREPGEFLEAIIIPRRQANIKVATYKLSKRVDQDISAICSAYAIQLQNNKIASVRIAHGGMAATSRRAYKAEEALLGATWDEAAVAKAMQALNDDYTPLTDMRATSTYRVKGAQNLLYRFYLESTGTAGTRI